MVKSVNASHILVSNARDAEGIMIRLSKGEEFAQLAKRFSKCPIASIARIATKDNYAELAQRESDDRGSSMRGGELGWFGKGEMVPEFEKACFEGQKGQVVGPVKTEFGYHIIMINDQK